MLKHCLSLKTFIPNFVAFFVLLEIAISFIRKMSLSVTSAHREFTPDLFHYPPPGRWTLPLAYTKPLNSISRALIGSQSRNILHEIDNMASRLPESSEINEKAIPINTKKATKFGLGVFQAKVLFLNIILRLNFTREAEIVTLT